MSIRTEFISYLERKKKVEESEEKLITLLDKQLEGKLKFPKGINKYAIESLELTPEGIKFNYSIVNYDESEPASIELE